MTFDQQIAVWCVAVPVAISLASCFAACLSRSRWPEFRWSDCAIAAGWWTAITVALAARQGWQWWPEDAWRQAIWPILGWAIVFAGFHARLRRPRMWVAAGILASVTALLAMPSGEQWSDTYHLHRTWMFAVTTSCLLNSFTIGCMAHHEAKRWLLWVALTAPAGSLLLAGSAYGSLAEWTVAVLAATIVIAVWGAFSVSSNAWVVAFPVLAAAASVTAAARFYTYDQLSDWIYAGALYGPTLVAIADYSIRRRPSWLRVTVSAIVSLVLLGLCAWAVQLG